MTAVAPACQDAGMAKAPSKIARAEFLSSTEELEARLFLDFFEAGLSALSQKATHARWRLYTNGEASELGPYGRVQTEILSDPGMKERLQRWRGHVRDPLLDRRIELLLPRALAAEPDRLGDCARLAEEVDALQRKRQLLLEEKLQNGNSFYRILQEESDRTSREAAFRIYTTVSEILQARLLALLQARREAAKALGAQSYFSRKLGAFGLEESFLRTFLEELEEVTDPPYRALLEETRRQLGISELAAWDLIYDPEHLDQKLEAYLPSHDLIARARELFCGMGLHAELERVFFTSPEAKVAWQPNLCFVAHPPPEIQVLVPPGRGPRPLRLLLHELGHAVYEAGSPPAPFTLQSPPSEGFAEGVAELFARQSEDSFYLHQTLGVPEDLAHRYFVRRRRERLISVRRLLALVHFEQRAYSAPIDDLEGLWADIASRFLHVPLPKDTLGWLAISALARRPASLSNHLLAEAISAQLDAYFREDFGSLWGSPEAGELLRTSVFAAGARYPWADLLEQLTGEPLRLRYLVEGIEEAS